MWNKKSRYFCRSLAWLSSTLLGHIVASRPLALLVQCDTSVYDIYLAVELDAAITLSRTRALSISANVSAILAFLKDM